MFFYGKKIGYFSLFERGEKISAAGFVKICATGNQVRLTVQVKGAERLSGQYPLIILTKDESIPFAVVTLTGGSGVYETCMTASTSGIILQGRQMPIEEIEGVKIEISDEVFVEARWKQIPRQQQVIKEAGEGLGELQVAENGQGEKTAKEKEAEISEADGNELKRKDVEISEPDRKRQPPFYISQEYSSDKWGQLLRQFRNVHPFGDDRRFISIELKDFVILREDYQKLIHNSFLLHGFYNYKHLILGKDCKIGSVHETCFYLGVPGVFYEREKMVAVMFGFEGFECDGPVEIGKYGYYLRQIQI